jgi:carbamoyl-phosphate synthase large subunit
MAFGRTFKEALQKVLRSMEQGRYGLGSDGKDEFDATLLSDDARIQWREKVIQRLRTPKAGNIFYLRHALKLGVSIDELFGITKIDRWFLHNIQQIIEMEEELGEYVL